ncbi:hypothetical protein P0Y35_06910 [Kiritimatiellaeota bacterium B1221]|nr:hypothetical protein [Kiritimatiellaeota bacterium B1221]
MDDSVTLPSFSQWVRGCGALLGLSMMVLGVVYSIRIFGWIVEGLKNPEVMGGILSKWETAMSDGEPYILNFAGGDLPLSKFCAVLVLAFGTWILVKIAFLFLSEGAKVISNTLGDQDAIKRILEHTFGPHKNRIPSEEDRLAQKKVVK